jgi:hypothetical protein
VAIYPGATFKPTSWGGRTARNKQGRGILHVAVSGARSLPPWNGNTWHFYVAKDGYCEQYVDTEYRAYASADANDDALSIETAGGLGSSAVLNAEPWTPAQMARLADIMRWESQQPGGAPLELLPDSKAGRRGWGPHRLGIKHSAGAVAGWWQPGGEVWSGSTGKECPGDAKVRQVPQAIEMARSGQAVEDDMFEAEDRELLRRVAQQMGGPGMLDVSGKTPWGWPTADGKQRTVVDMLRDWIPGFGRRTENTEAMVAGLGGAIGALAAAQPAGGLSAEAIEAAVAKALRENIVQVNVDVSGDDSAA